MLKHRCFSNNDFILEAKSFTFQPNLVSRLKPDSSLCDEDASFVAMFSF